MWVGEFSSNDEMMKGNGKHARAIVVTLPRQNCHNKGRYEGCSKIQNERTNQKEQEA